MTDANLFYADIIGRLEAQDLIVATTAVAHGMAVISAAHGDLDKEASIAFLRERLVPMVVELLSMMDLDEATMRRRLQ